MNSHSRLLFFLSTATIVMLAVACGSAPDADSAPASAPNETTVPTSTPAVFVPITFAIGSAEFLEAIPKAERDCVVSDLGPELYGTAQASQGFNIDVALAGYRCMSSDSLARLLLGSLLSGNSELSENTGRCITQRLGPLDVSVGSNGLAELATLSPFGNFGEISQQLIVELFPVVFCLNDDERAVFEENNSFGAPISAQECLYDGVLSVGLDFVSLANKSNAEPGAEMPEAFQQVALGCGFEATGQWPVPEQDSREREIGTPVPFRGPPEPAQ